LNIQFENINYKNRPVLLLKSAGGGALGILGNAVNPSFDIKYNELSTIEFDLPAYVNGEATPFYEDTVGMRVIDIDEIGQFILTNPKETGEGATLKKSLTGYSLEYEFTYKKISLEEGTYRFYDASGQTESVMSIIMDLMPSWSIGTVPNAIAIKYRTFELNNENLYNFMKNTLQETYGCVFEFDTRNRVVNVRDINEQPSEQPVYLSQRNLIKELEIEENTEDIVTRLDVNGADGVNIRDCNPGGTNKIIDLSYFMTTDNFTSSLIEKYNAWKTLYEAERPAFFDMTVQYTLRMMQYTAEEAKLTDMKNDLAGLETQRGVVIQAIAEGLQTEDDLLLINIQIEMQEAAIEEQGQVLVDINTQLSSLVSALTDIRNRCNFENYFEDYELLAMDRYIRDGEITESSFVADVASTYLSEGTGQSMDSLEIGVTQSTTGSDIEDEDGHTSTFLDGALTIGNVLTAQIVSATFECKSGKLILTATLGAGNTREGEEFESACVTVTGRCSNYRYIEGSGVLLTATDAYSYFSLNANEYKRRKVAMDLYEYGTEVLASISQPTYNFSLSAANFFALDEYVAFKNKLELGQRVYIEVEDGRVITPICIGVKFNLNDPTTFDMEFGSSYKSMESAFQLTDLLEQSVSMGRTVELSRFTYEAFVSSGAQDSIRNALTSALDVAKNNIMSSSSQAVSWDASGIHLRRWNTEHTDYEGEQIWLCNNMIAMTSDGWQTAELAIGKFQDENLGTCWGIVAPMVVGTMIAGSKLVIESQKQDGGTAVFRMDENGCKLFNTDFSIATSEEGDGNHIVLNPELGIAIGSYPVYTLDEDNNPVLDTDNAKFWIVTDGNIHMIGNITATGLNIVSEDDVFAVDDYVRTFTDPIHDGTSGIYFTSNAAAVCQLNTTVGLKITNTDGSYFRADGSAMGFFKRVTKQGAFSDEPMLYYSEGNMTLAGTIKASDGFIGGEDGWHIASGAIYSNTAESLGDATGIHIGKDGISVAGNIVFGSDGTFAILRTGDYYHPKGITGVQAVEKGIDDEDYLFRISRDQDETTKKSTYRMYLGDINLDGSFVLPVQNGGTGAMSKMGAGASFGLYRALEVSDMTRYASYADNGDLCILYSDGSESTTQVTGGFTTDGFIGVGSHLTHDTYLNYGQAKAQYWNCANLSGEAVDTSVYCRAGYASSGPVSTAAWMPLNVVVPQGASVTELTITVPVNTRPAGSTRIYSDTWSILPVKLCSDTSTVIATTTLALTGLTATDNDVVCRATFSIPNGIASGTYFLVFYGNTGDNMCWLKYRNITIANGQASGATGLYIMSDGQWVNVVPSNS